jgi:hypothetical protein
MAALLRLVAILGLGSLRNAGYGKWPTLALNAFSWTLLLLGVDNGEAQVWTMKPSSKVSGAR